MTEVRRTGFAVEPSTPLAYRAEDAFKKIGIGRTTGYAEIRSGRLLSFRVGKRRLVPAYAIPKYIADRLAEQPEGGDAAC
jgi:hypothetical protein